MSVPVSHGRSGRPWRRLREQVLREEPYCTVRGPKCRGVSTTVDHIVPLSLDPSLAHVRSNLRGACSACNYRGGALITNRRVVLPRRVVPACTWQPGRLCSPKCDGFPLPEGCKRSSERRW